MARVITFVVVVAIGCSRPSARERELPASSQPSPHEREPTQSVPGGPEAKIRFTPRAAARIHEIGRAEGLGDSGLRVRVVPADPPPGFNYDLYYDDATAADHRFETGGVKVIVDPTSLGYLAGTEIDYVEGAQGAGFKFNNPNVRGVIEDHHAR